MVRKNGGIDDRPIEWYRHGMQKWRNDLIPTLVRSHQTRCRYRDYSHMLYRPIEWYAKMAESIIDLLNGMQKWQNDDRPIEWYVKMTESIDHPRHDIDTETTVMRYSSIEWCVKMAESIPDSGTDDRHV